MSNEILGSIEDSLKLSEELRKAIEASPEHLLDMDLRRISRELSKKFNELREITRFLIEQRKERISLLRDERNKRDELNEKVKEVAQAIKQLRTRRKELQQFINEKKNEGNQLKNKIKELTERIQLLEKELKGFSRRELKKIEANIERLEWALQTQSLPDIIERRLTERILRLSERLKHLKEKEEKWKELQRMRQELEKYKMDLNALRRSLAIYYEERRKIDEKITELIKIRDERKSEADKHHTQVQELRKEVELINEKLAKIRDLRNKIMQTLKRISKIREEQEELKRKEELKRIIAQRLREIQEKFLTQGKLDYEDLEFLVEHGLLTDDFLDRLLTMSEEEQAEAILEQLEGSDLALKENEEDVSGSVDEAQQ